MNTILHKKFALHLARILFGLLVMVVLLAWLASTEAALQWGARQAERISNGRLSLHRVHGSLYGPVRIESLSFQSSEQRIEVKEVFLDWTPHTLLALHMQINRLSMQELKVIRLKPAIEPARIPASLRLPLTLSAPDITLAHVVLADGKTEHMLGDIKLGLDLSGENYRLRLERMDTGWGNAEGEMVLWNTQPYSILAHASLQQKQGFIYRADAEVTGNLTELEIKTKVKALDGKAEIDATLNPLDAMPVAAARITADSINPARYSNNLPAAALGMDISVQRRAGGILDGSVRMRNELPGLWDQSRLPVHEISLQFSGAADKLALNALNLDMDKAGKFTGKGQISRGNLQLDMSTGNLNPQQLHGKLRQMHLAGNIRLRSGQKWQSLSADLRYQRIKLHLDARHQDAVLELRKAIVQAGAGSLNMHGRLALDKSRRFQLSAALKNLNPANFGDYPAAQINASLSADGRLTDEPQARLKFSAADSHFRHQPLYGQGSLSLSAARMWDSDIKLRLGHNHLKLNGGLGNPDDQFSVEINAGRLAEFDTQLGGQVLATGKFGGRFTALSGQFNLQISDLSWRKRYRVDSLQAKGMLDEGLDGPLALDAHLQGLLAPQLSLDQASLNAQGTRSQHTLNFAASNSTFDIASQFSGGWHDGAGWSGLMQALSGKWQQDFALRSSAKLEVASDHFVLGRAAFDYGEASLVLHETRFAAGHITSSGEFRNLPLAYAHHFTEKTAGLKTDLELNANWEIDIAEQVNGHVALWRERGDISLPAQPEATLGLKRLTLNVDAQNNLLQGRLEADGSKLGSLTADAQLMLSRRNDAWGIAGNAPVSANANLSVESLAWLAPLVNRSGALAFDGAITAEVHAQGTFAQPRLSGTISGEQFNLTLPNQGLRFTDGRFQLKLLDQVLLLEQLSMRGGKGSLIGRGQLSLEENSPRMKLSLTADKLEVLSRPDRLLIISGTGNASATGKKLHIESNLRADHGLIEMSRDSEYTSSDDVIVLQQDQAAEKKGPPYNLNFDLDMDLGERFYIKGKGLDAQLGGTLKLSSKDGALPTSRGNIRVIKGAYSAYGQRLVVERGILNFQGPLDNPGLNFIALRKNQPVEAGVSIGGTAQSPRVKLVSNPDVPDSEKLSWLVLGHGLENSSGKDYTALNAAAGVLLTAGESITLQQKIAHASGFEDVSVRGSGELEGTVLSLGKRLSSRAYLNYEQGLTNASSLVKINYTLTRRLSVQAQAGSTPAMDLFYTFSYD